MAAAVSAVDRRKAGAVDAGFDFLERLMWIPGIVEMQEAIELVAHGGV